jgi:SAM-dependent methyltransferase
MGNAMIFVRILLVAVLVAGVSTTGILAVAIIRFSTDLAVPGWATTAVGSLLVILLQTVVIIAAASLTMLAGRSNRPIIPILDSQPYIVRRERSRVRPGEPPRTRVDDAMTHVGSELELFANARNWKAYFSSVLAPFIGARVLEVGAGIVSNIPYLYTPAVCQWVSAEPDPSLACRITEQIARGELPATCRVVVGTLESVKTDSRFDTIIYIDVLEHVAEDAGELARAARLLAPQGKLVVLAPAHQFLFSQFDAAIGHYRRYDIASVTALSPPGCRLRACLMLDSAGFFASLTNRLLLAAAMPSTRQIAFWDKVFVPISRLLDNLAAHKFGKTIIAVWVPS